MVRAGRVILHLDMDAFFAAVEQRERPELRGKPIIIGHPGPRGVVATCSYEARPFGVRSAMPSVTAQRLCPEAIWVRGRMSLYREVSRRIFALLGEHAPVVEQVSVDEAYADLVGAARDLSEGAAIARELKDEIRAQEALTASVGVAPCRFLAKVSSDLEKPDGLVVMPLEEVPRRLWPLSVRVIPGVGPRLGERLARLGITKVGDIARASITLLESQLGRSTARWLRERAQGHDERPVEPPGERKQVSEERTYSRDLRGREAIRRELRARAEGVAETLRRRGLVARTVTLKARDPDYRTLTRSHVLDEPTDLAQEIFDQAAAMFDDKVPFRALRLLGVGAKDLLPAGSVTPPLFPDERRERARALAKLGDELRARYGAKGARPASLLGEKEREGGVRPGEDDEGLAVDEGLE